MPTPATHAADLAPSIITALSAVTLYLFNQPLAVLVTAAGGAMWAVWRNETLTFSKSVVWVIVASLSAMVLVELAVWALHTLFGYDDAPVRALAGLIAFIIVDKPWRDRLYNFLATKLMGVEVKK